MLAALVVMLRSLALICCGHRAVALENLALRQQLAVFRRTGPRPPVLRQRNRLCWVLLAQAWRDWRTALIVVRPDTVVRWHRQWLRRRWTQRSTPTRPGRPRTNAAIRRLVEQMGAANPVPAEKSVPVAMVDVAGRPWIRFSAMIPVLLALLWTLRGLRSRAACCTSRCWPCGTSCRCWTGRGLGGCGSRAQTAGSGSGCRRSGLGGERRSSWSNQRRSSPGTAAAFGCFGRGRAVSVPVGRPYRPMCAR
jgi:hypothetical protein